MNKQRVSYAQNHEDIRAWRTLRELGVNSKSVYYVELGVREPWADSNTAYFYEQGAHGLLVEADPVLMNEIVRKRPKDISVNAFISSVDEGRVQFFSSPQTGLGTASDEFKKLGESRGFDFKAIEIESITVNSLINRLDISEIHFLSIDIEGGEMKALMGIDFTRIRPWIICVETIQPGTNTVVNDKKTDYLLSNDYHLVHFDGVNNWYIADEYSHVSKILTVPFSAVDKGLHGWTSYRDIQVYQRRNQIRVGARGFTKYDPQGVETGQNNAEEYETKVTLSNTVEDVDSTEECQIHNSSTSINLASDNADCIENEGWTFTLNNDQSRLLKFHSDAVQSQFDTFTPIAFRKLPSSDWAKSFSVSNAPMLLNSKGDQSFSEFSVTELDLWLKKHSLSSDLNLKSRLDANGDKWGTYIANLIAFEWFLKQDPKTKVRTRWEPRDLSVLFDATCLQTSAYAERGIGKYAREILQQLLLSNDVNEVTLFLDPLQGKAPAWLLKHEKIKEESLQSNEKFDLFVTPSPMTLEPWQLKRGLQKSNYSSAYVYDFIPAKYSTHYLQDEIARQRNLVQVRALTVFDQITTISKSTRADLAKLVNVKESSIGIAWPGNLQSVSHLSPQDFLPKDYVTIFGGDEARKNLFVGLASWGAATAYLESRPKAFVVGYGGNQSLIDQVAASAGLRPGEAVALPFLEDSQFIKLISSSMLSIVPSLEEGLSLPVIESLSHSVPVAASLIQPHIELCGKSEALGDPRSVEHFANAITYVLNNRTKVLANQSKKLRKYKHEKISTTVLTAITSAQRNHQQESPVLSREKTQVQVIDNSNSEKISIGFVTPWPTQQSGVADYSKTTLEELGDEFDITIYTDAHQPVSTKSNLSFRPTSDALQGKQRHDLLINIIGNSHFHLPALWNLRLNGGLVVAHDSRMYEFYHALLGQIGLERFLGYKPNSDKITHEIQTCTYENVVFGELAHFSGGMFMHSSKSSQRVEEENGTKVRVLPFVPMRTTVSGPRKQKGESESIAATLSPNGTIQIASFGGMDERTKRESVIVDACLLLRMWGIPVELTFVGDHSNVPSKNDLSTTLASCQMDASWIHLLGRLDEEKMVEQIRGAHLIVQLRSGPHFTTSGPVIDAIGHGKKVIASSNLVDDVYPSFVTRCPENVSALELAETIRHQLGGTNGSEIFKDEIDVFMATFSAKNYASELVSALLEMRKI